MTFPKAQWLRCLEAVVLLGIETVQEKLGDCVLLDQLELEAKKTRLRIHSTGTVSPLSSSRAGTGRPQSSPHQRARHRPLIMYPNLPVSDLRARPVPLDEDTPRFNLNDTPKSGRQLSPKVVTSPRARLTLSNRGKVETPRKLPKYLENVESKIKPQVKRDIKEFKCLLDTSKPKRKNNLRKSSSFGDLTQWSESLIGVTHGENKENELTEPNVSVYNPSPDVAKSIMLCEPNTSSQYAKMLKPMGFSETCSLQTTGKFTSEKTKEQHVLSITEQLLDTSSLLDMSNRSYHITDFISTSPMHPTKPLFIEGGKTAPVTGNSRYIPYTKEYEARRNEFVRRLSSISSISSVVPEEELRKSPTPTQGNQGEKPTPSSTSSFPWMDSYSPNTSFYDREDIRNPMYQDSLLSRFL